MRIDNAISFDDGDGKARPVLALEQLLDPGLECALVTIDRLRTNRRRRRAARHGHADHEREGEARSGQDEGWSFDRRHSKNRSIIIFATLPMSR